MYVQSSLLSHHYILLITAVLVGYGFCLPENSADEVAIRLGRPPDPVIPYLEQLYKTNCTCGWTASEANFHLRGHQYFSGGYHDQLSWLSGVPPIMFETVLAISAYARGMPFQKASEAPPRLIIAAARQLLMALQAKRTNIVRHKVDLPSEPQNEKQILAKIYRDGQIQILDDVIGDISQRLTGLLRNDDRIQQTHVVFGIFTLDALLSIWQREDADTHGEFVNGVESVFGSSDVDALREADCEDLIWGLCLCAIHIGILCKDEKKGSFIYRSIKSLQRDYNYSEDQDMACDPADDPDGLEFVMDQVRLAAQTFPDSLWADSRWTTSLYSRFGSRMARLEAWQTPISGTEYPAYVTYLEQGESS